MWSACGSYSTNLQSATVSPCIQFNISVDGWGEIGSVLPAPVGATGIEPYDAMEDVLLALALPAGALAAIR